VSRPITSSPLYYKDPCIAELHEVTTNKNTSDNRWTGSGSMNELSIVIWLFILTAELYELSVDTSLEAEYSIQLQML
jgi:hypothetical protein